MILIILTIFIIVRILIICLFIHLFITQELSTALKTNGLLLTAAISADKNTINDAYDIPEISKYLDFIHVMAYDYHGAWDKWVLPNAPLKCSDKLCVVRYKK